MKRALAERAKQSLPQQQQQPPQAPPPPPTNSSPPEQQPPHKLPRLDVATTTTTTKPTTASSTRNSRIQSLTAQVASEEHDNASSFYLKHQNRALATELKSLQFAVNALEQERDYRRQQCLAACQALNSLQATWTQLETALSSASTTTTTTSVLESSPDAPACTGSGADAVEWTRALANALAALGGGDSNDHSGDAPPDKTVEQFYADLSQLSANVAARARILQEQIWAMASASSSSNQDVSQADWQAQLAAEQAQKRLLELQIAELTISRNETATQERKLRRNLYRLACGMLTQEQVIKAVDREAHAHDEIWNQVKLEAAQQPVPTPTSAATVKPIETESSAGEKGASSAQVDEFEKRIANLETAVSNRETTIQDLTAKLKDKELEINRLSLTQQSEQDIEKLKSLQATRLKLELKGKLLEESESKLETTREKWSQALGNEGALQAALDEQLSKFQKRWSEFTNAMDSPSADEEVSADIEQVAQAKQIIELQHKLNQAIENVRQAESTRQGLAEALEMNQQLQSRLDEIKTKYTMLQASRSNNSSRQGEPDGNADSGEKGSATDANVVPPRQRDTSSSEKPSGELSSKYEKLHREYKKVRKELATVSAGKEATKSKLERSEKERESLVDTNTRLLRQSTEKDEMNAKSLSTILHLKSLTEQLTVERDNLEQQVKSASQLALAARLATNAKERVSEEVLKEKEELQKALQALEKEHAETKAQLENVTRDWSEGSGKLTTLNSQLANALKRSEELVAENQAKADEVRRLIDSADKAQREAREYEDKLNKVLQSSDGDMVTGASTFTVDQLNTQISVLKGRLACPVCHYRDKECIIMRCRHMHCKQCVEERISNRSRKCPTCNNKFSEKDVEDIWLS